MINLHSEPCIWFSPTRKQWCSFSTKLHFCKDDGALVVESVASWDFTHLAGCSRVGRDPHKFLPVATTVCICSGVSVVAGPLSGFLGFKYTTPFSAKSRRPLEVPMATARLGRTSLGGKTDLFIVKKQNWPEATGRASWDRLSIVGLVLRQKTVEV